MAEVDEIHVPKKETVDLAITSRYLRSESNRSGLSVSRPGTNYSKGGGAGGGGDCCNGGGGGGGSGEGAVSVVVNF